MKTANRIKAFFLFFEKMGERIKRAKEMIMSGEWGAQSLNMAWIRVHKDPIS